MDSVVSGKRRRWKRTLLNVSQMFFVIVVIYEYGFCGQTEEAEKDPVEHLGQLFVNPVFTQRPKPWRRSS